MKEYTICPICGKVAYHSSHFKAFTCGGCGWFKYADEAKPTNADRIRAMSDEKLAEFLLSWVECDKEEYMCAPTGRNRLGTCNGRCINGRINWLQQPAEEG